MDNLTWQMLGGGAIGVLMIREVLSFLKERSNGNSARVSFDPLVSAITEAGVRQERALERLQDMHRESCMREIEIVGKLDATLGRIELKLDRLDDTANSSRRIA